MYHNKNLGAIHEESEKEEEEGIEENWKKIQWQDESVSIMLCAAFVRILPLCAR